MRILLTGSGGFVGKNLKEYFCTEHELLTPRSFELNLIEQNQVETFFNHNKIDFIIHCGSVGGYRTQKDKDTTIENNLAMVKNLLKYKRENCRVILFGSGAMYDKNRSLDKVKESEIGHFIPKDLYGKSKLEISKIVCGRDDVLCLNIFGCYGKYEKETRFPTYAITQNLNNQKITINQNVIFDYIYIDDLCRIIEYFIGHKPANKIINVTPDKSISLLEIANLVNEIGKNKTEIEVLNPVMGNQYTGSNALLKTELKDFKFTDYKTGLIELFNFIKDGIYEKN